MPPRHVLVIDDQLSLLHFLRCSMQDHWLGCRVDVAHSSGQAAPLLASQRYDVIVTDYDLQDGNGLELAALAHRHKPDVPVVMITAAPPEPLSSAVGMACHGIAALLPKPFDLWQLLETIEEATVIEAREVANG